VNDNAQAGNTARSEMVRQEKTVDPDSADNVAYGNQEQIKQQFSRSRLEWLAAGTSVFLMLLRIIFH